jgi:hypothetical protein
MIRKAKHSSEPLLPYTREYAITAIRLPWLCQPQLVAGDLGPAKPSHLILLGDDSTLKTKTQQSIEIARFLVSILVAGIGFEPMTFRL